MLGPTHLAPEANRLRNSFNTPFSPSAISDDHFPFIQGVFRILMPISQTSVMGEKSGAAQP